MRTFEEAEGYVHALTHQGSQKSLARMRRLMALLGDPQDRLRFVHVAGTNGKGSTVQLLSAVMTRAGYRVGTYLSPYVTEFRERFQIDGEKIEREAFAALVDETAPYIQALSDEGEQVTEFEMITAVAFRFFAERGCELVVLETGLGGRLDATNIIKTPDCAVITAISLDHTAILGDTVGQIAREKAGIIKEGTDAVAYAKEPPEALAALYEACAETGSRLIQPNPLAVQILSLGPSGSRFSYSGQVYSLRLAGEHQIYNAVSVIEAVRVLRRKGFSVPEGALLSGLAEVSFPGRFEVIGERPLVILDGAHNPAALEALARSLSGLEASPRVAIVGMMQDKDCRRGIEALCCVCSHLIAVSIKDNPRSLPAKELSALAGEKGEAAADYGEALARAGALAGEAGAVIVCGSFYLVSDIRRLFPGRLC